MNKIYQKPYLSCKNPVKRRLGGFTLIELLVVVLIIGILAGVAVPQYQKAVWKSRAVQLQTAVKSVATAQEAHYMANGAYATEYSQLDVSFDNLRAFSEAAGLSVVSRDAVRGNDDFQIALNIRPTAFTFSTGTFRRGPYQYCGFFYIHSNTGGLADKSLLCGERVDAPVVAGDFCKMYGGSSTPVATLFNYRYYRMP